MRSETLAARRRRIARIRRGVVAATLAAFALAWGVIAYDGPMGVATTSASSSNASSGGSSSGSESLAPVTTAQSQMAGEHVFWITSRAAGVVALLAASAAVTAGLLMSGRSLRGRAAVLRTTHEALALATIAAIVLHAVALLGDSYMSPSVADISIPFVSGYQRLWTTTGIVAGWMLIALGLSYYARGRIGPARWRRLHRFTALAWLLGVLHGLFEGTDAGSAWFLIGVAAAALPAGALLTARLAAEPTPAPQR